MYFIDVQGTLISDSDKSPIKGSCEFIEKLNNEGIPYVLITNNTKHTSDDFLSFLQKSGFKIETKHYIDPLMILKEVVDAKKVSAYGTPEFLKITSSLGYEIDFQNPEAILIAIKKDFLPDEYAQMIEALLNGAKLIGMHETSIYAKEGKRYPGVGAILKMLSFATQKEYEVVGKPSKLFYQKALEKLQSQNPSASFEKITIISDDVMGDLVGAKKLGMQTVFVTSGKFKNTDEIIPNIEENLRPDMVKADISELL